MRGAVVVAVLVVIAAVAVVLWLRARRAAQRPVPRRDPLADLTGTEQLLHELKAGDVVSHEGRDWLVRGSLRFDQDGAAWAEHLVAEGREQRWLGVADDEGLVVTWWQRVGIAEVDGEPGAREVRMGGAAYRLRERGEAAFRAEGTTGTAPAGTARYADYRGDGDARLSFEHFGGAWEVSTGTDVLPRSLTVYVVEE